MSKIKVNLKRTSTVACFVPMCKTILMFRARGLNIAPFLAACTPFCSTRDNTDTITLGPTCATLTAVVAVHVTAGVLVTPPAPVVR